jgi:hypothetical protein
MTNRSRRRRLAQAERRFLSTLEKRVEIWHERNERTCSLARLHATAVAAIVLSGDPKVDEPLIRAWARTLAHYKLEPYSPNVRSIFEAMRLLRASSGASVDDREADCLEAVQKSKFKDYLDATQGLYPIVMNGAKEERARFTEIFSAAPVWLLAYTFTMIDAKLLKFDLPDLSAAPQWGEIGRGGARRRWPKLPVGVMTEGDPIAKQEIDPSLSAEDCVFALRMLDKPEDEWTRMERRRMLDIGPRLGWTPE